MRPHAEREEELLLALTHRVRFLSTGQAARTFWPGASEDAVRKRLERLARRGLVRRIGIVAHPELPLDAPVLMWKSGDPTPDFDEASRRCRARWVHHPASMTAWRATAYSVAYFGGVAMPLHIGQATHDLHVGALFCRAVVEAPQDAARWCPEDAQVALADERLPDALIRDESGRVLRVVEFGGACKPGRIARLHQYSQDYDDIPYQLW